MDMLLPILFFGLILLLIYTYLIVIPNIILDNQLRKNKELLEERKIINESYNHYLKIFYYKSINLIIDRIKLKNEVDGTSYDEIMVALKREVEQNLRIIDGEDILNKIEKNKNE